MIWFRQISFNRVRNNYTFFCDVLRIYISCIFRLKNNFICSLIILFNEFFAIAFFHQTLRIASLGQNNLFGKFFAANKVIGIDG